MKIKCIIIEDEPLALRRTKEYVEKLPALQLLQTFDNAFEALDFLQKEQVDLLFLDIHLDELSGIQLLESLEKKPQVIITTAYNEYALRGYELNVSDYLLKPFGLERFIQAVNKVIQSINTHSSRELAQRDYFFVKSDYKLEKILLKEIYFIEGMRDYRAIHLQNKKILTSQTFSELAADLPGSVICRVHKSFMVAIDKIEHIERNRIKIRDHYIPISDTYKEQFFEEIGLSGEGKKP